METILVNQDNNKIEKFLNQAIEKNQPILLKGETGNAVLISESEWNAIQETLYLSSIPNMIESIKKGGKTPLSECIEESSIRDILNG
ncbi:type II toxin-antitoxin system Phd/YefM family antitoxin [Geminocystis sp. NIES-3709]|uniref:type II toxin-antitoxin system Phd/YefM family antitoxin n=1 Tax=Geminocystis sp. NIES-3709 TaxID=1617448 RepID=UPI0005FC4857|nr:type II toxin-antitoxin system Phd/YefM family antitoxin [Geminocystis sp. NIES-3709]BAQ67040.1 RelB/StbD replicon stabilization protein [Geminocystis sp. NIES-3709]